MAFYRSFLISGLLLLFGLTGCSSNGNNANPTANGGSTAGPGFASDSVYTLLQEAGTNALRDAFDARSGIRYFRRTHTRQMDPSTGRSIASYERLVRHEPVDDGGIETVDVDSSGRFELGILSQLMRRSAGPQRISNPIPHLLPDDPAYLSDRGPGLYSYEMLADTSIGGRPTAVAKLSAGSGATDDQQIRAARFYIDRSTMELVGVRLRRQQGAILFSEETTLEVYLQRIGSNQWFPERTHYRTTLDIPFLSSKQLQTESHYFTRPPEG